MITASHGIIQTGRLTLNAMTILGHNWNDWNTHASGNDWWQPHGATPAMPVHTGNSDSDDAAAKPDGGHRALLGYFPA
eukprot:18802-Heterococcus_DN1.PRE.4